MLRPALSYVVVGFLATFVSAVVASAAPIPLAEPDANGFRWVTVDHPGNPAYLGPSFDNRAYGRGSVGYSYRISQLEIDSGQWAEFFVALNHTPGVPSWMTFAALPFHWGGNVPIPEWRSLPVDSLSWRICAVYCNWLHNDKAPGLASFMSGAYDVSTFTSVPGNPNPNGSPSYTDQRHHSPGAKFWIPTLDEWVKAAYWDPTKPADGGWWQYPNMTDDHLPVGGFAGQSPVPSIPSFAETSTGFELINGAADTIWYQPVGSYANTVSYFGLRDVSGGATEWTEEYSEDRGHNLRSRLLVGSAIGWVDAFLYDRDNIGSAEWDWYRPSSFNKSGLRLASLVPAPAPCVGAIALVGFTFCSRRRTSCCVSSFSSSPP